MHELWKYIASQLDVVPKTVYLGVPIGFLWGLQSLKRPQKWQWLSAMILGVSLSVVIELLQYSFKKGCVELDDVIHNTLGCLIGFVLWRGVCAILRDNQKRTI